MCIYMCLYSQCDLVAAPEPSEELLEPAVGVEGLPLARVEHHHLLLNTQQQTCRRIKGIRRRKHRPASLLHTQSKGRTRTRPGSFPSPPLSVPTYTYVGYNFLNAKLTDAISQLPFEVLKAFHGVSPFHLQHCLL